MTDPLLVTTAGGVRTLTLNRPDQRNALSPDLLEALVGALEACASDHEVRCVVLAGAGKAFCAGGDITTMIEGRPGGPVATVDRLTRGLHRIARLLWDLEKPVIAKIHGDAAGAGFSLALLCDLLYASTEARMGLTFVRVGLVPDTGATFTLPRRLGLHKAKELAFFGELIPASEAFALGLVNGIMTPEDLDKHVEEMAARLASLPTKAIGLAKKGLQAGASSDLFGALEREASLQATASTTQDHLEGTAAFVEKRKPAFTGK